MKYVNWKWSLPIVQLALALACHVYDGHEYRVGAHRDRAVNNMEYRFQHTPALAESISQGINFPALVLVYPFRNNYNPVIYERNSEYTYISVYPRDVGFFFGIVLFWYWVGRTLNASQRRSPGTTWPRKARITGLACGVVFGMLTGAYADQMIASKWFPQRLIGAFGIAWASALIAYFTWRLIREFGTGRNAKRSLLAAIVTMSIVAVLWIGGPFGATQALGEYLRPTTVTMMPLSAECTTNETPPLNVMRIVESQEKFYRSALQKVVVCRAMFGLPQSDPRFAGSTFEPETLRRWLPLKAGCCTRQFRRHFAVVIADEKGTVIVEAALIQSRWDYLRLNWDKIRISWFWPYPGK